MKIGRFFRLSRYQIRILVLVGAALVALVALLVWISRWPADPRISAAHVVRENLISVVTTNGKVEAVEPSVLRAQIDSLVVRVAASEGRQVRRGELLLQLDAAQTRADLARAREALLTAQEDLRAARAGGRADELAQLDSDLRKSTAEVERLRSEFAAIERLAAKQAATPEEVAKSRLALERAEAGQRLLDQRKSELARRSKLDADRALLLADRARNEIAALEQKARQADLTSPVDGTLYLLPLRAGDYVHVGDLLAEVADLRKVRVRAFVDEPDLGMLEPGQPVEISWDALATRVWKGRTEQVPKTVITRGNRSVGEVLCSAANDPVELLPNTNVNVRIRVRERQGALVVARGAVRSEGTRRFVFLVQDGALGVQSSTLLKQEIKVGIFSATSFEVLEGLKEGDKVALLGDADLADGMRVKVVMEK